jgi:hypothetical protein
MVGEEGRWMAKTHEMSIAMMIVNQLFDKAEVSVEKRQAINDDCYKYMNDIIVDYGCFVLEKAGRTLNAKLEAAKDFTQ